MSATSIAKTQENILFVASLLNQTLSPLDNVRTPASKQIDQLSKGVIGYCSILIVCNLLFYW